MNLLTGWDDLRCSICDKHLGVIYVRDDYDLEVKCLDCIDKEEKEK